MHCMILYKVILHRENCEVESIKTGRRFYPRPYFMSPSIDLSFNNWIVVSNQYKTKTFKQVLKITRTR